MNVLIKCLQKFQILQHQQIQPSPRPSSSRLQKKTQKLRPLMKTSAAAASSAPLQKLASRGQRGGKKKTGFCILVQQKFLHNFTPKYVPLKFANWRLHARWGDFFLPFFLMLPKRSSVQIYRTGQPNWNFEYGNFKVWRFCHFCVTDFTWNQFWLISEGQKLPFW